MREADGYLLRIATQKWVDQVFDTTVYYTNISRKWKPGQTILLLHKTAEGDAIVGYGAVEKAAEKGELPEEEKLQCEKGNWKRAIEFKYIVKFKKPLLIKETFLKDSKLRGRYFHGLRLTKKQLDAIIAQAES